MPISDLTSHDAVMVAVAEFDRLGRGAFLSRYGYGRARNYFLRVNDRYYDSKAIAGVAYGYQFPARGALKPHQFSGGDKTVKKTLEKMRLTVEVL